jgi:phosphoribosylformylglycinamidine cyclo-ligase
MFHGLAHITGGGLVDNLPRILPNNYDAVIEQKLAPFSRIFQILQRNGEIDPAEMYQVFNIASTLVANFRRDAQTRCRH